MTWLEAFKNRHSADGVSPPTGSSPASLRKKSISLLALPLVSRAPEALPSGQFGDLVVTVAVLVKGVSAVMVDRFVFCSEKANCYRRLARDLGPWVAATTSPNDPNQHIPTDAELQHQDRWILYNDDDSWNQTATDHVEWLWRFKRSNDILNDGGSHLTNSDSWSIAQGGSGFAPPYAWLNPHGSVMPAFNYAVAQASMAADGASTRSFPPTDSHVASSFVENLCSRYARPATIFFSRELEETGHLPSTAALRACAREVLGVEGTPADDPELMDKLQRWMAEKMPHATVSDEGKQEGPSFLDVQLSDEELGNILQDMDFDLTMGEYDGGVSLTGLRA